jgi:hypothetical protein
MAAYPPLIIKNGEFQRLPAADSIFARKTFTLSAGALLGYGQTLSYADDFAKTFQVLKLESVLAYPVRLRLYATAAARDTDATRSPTVLPVAQTEHKVILDVYMTDATGYIWTMSPIADGSTEDGTATIFFAIDNGSPLALSPQVTVTYLAFE